MVTEMPQIGVSVGRSILIAAALYTSAAFGTPAESRHDASMPDISMMLGDATKTKLATKEVATQLAEALIMSLYGRDELKGQLPFRVYDEDDHWTIVGNGKLGQSPPDVTDLNHGAAHIEIAKSDCRVISFYREGSFYK